MNESEGLFLPDTFLDKMKIEQTAYCIKSLQLLNC